MIMEIIWANQYGGVDPLYAKKALTALKDLYAGPAPVVRHEMARPPRDDKTKWCAMLVLRYIQRIPAMLACCRNIDAVSGDHSYRYGGALAPRTVDDEPVSMCHAIPNLPCRGRMSLRL